MILPLSEPIRGVDGALISEIPVPKDTVVQVGIMGSNMNKKIWGEDAWEWKPERWLAPLGWSVPIPGLRDMMQIARTLEEKSLEIYTKKKAALLQGDEALAMQVGEGKDIMSICCTLSDVP